MGLSVTQEQTKTNPWLTFVEAYQDNPVAFVRHVVGMEPQDWQKEVLEAVAKGQTRLSIRSGHGVGKSATLSWLMVWYMTTRFPVKIVVTAPTEGQLFDAVFAEVKGVIAKLPPAIQKLFDVKRQAITHKKRPNEAFISARTSSRDRPEAMAGVHAEHVMLIADEASGVPEEVFQAASGSMSTEGAITLLTGNPTRTNGLFYETHNALAGQWWTRKVSCLESRLVSQEYIDEKAAQYGEDSNEYRIRVLGEFPTSNEDAVIPRFLVEEAVDRDVQAYGGIVWGLDVARMGGDKSALAKRQNNCLLEPVKFWKDLDLMELCGAVKAEYDSTPDKEQPGEILIDAIGLGAGVADRLREMGLPASSINVGETPPLKGRHVRFKDQLWFDAREWFHQRQCSIPNQPELIEELTVPAVKYMSNGKVRVESKDEIKRRGAFRDRRSPDLADAFVLTFAGMGVAAYAGSSRSWSRHKTLGIDTSFVV